MTSSGKLNIARSVFCVLSFDFPVSRMKNIKPNIHNKSNSFVGIFIYYKFWKINEIILCRCRCACYSVHATCAHAFTFIYYGELFSSISFCLIWKPHFISVWHACVCVCVLRRSVCQSVVSVIWFKPFFFPLPQSVSLSSGPFFACTNKLCWQTYTCTCIINLVKVFHDVNDRRTTNENTANAWLIMFGFHGWCLNLHYAKWTHMCKLDRVGRVEATHWIGMATCVRANEWVSDCVYDIYVYSGWAQQLKNIHQM